MRESREVSQRTRVYALTVEQLGRIRNRQQLAARGLGQVPTMELERALSALIDGASGEPWSSGPLKKPDFKRDKQLRSKYDHYPIREPSAPDEYKASVGYKERWFVLNPEGGGTLDYYRAKARSRAPSRKRVRNQASPKSYHQPRLPRSSP